VGAAPSCRTRARMAAQAKKDERIQRLAPPRVSVVDLRPLRVTLALKCVSVRAD
jgi:hypothetical protein